MKKEVYVAGDTQLMLLIRIPVIRNTDVRHVELGSSERDECSFII